MSKRDRQGVRTPSDIEVKYNLGQLRAVREAASQNDIQLNETKKTLKEFMESTVASISNLLAHLDNVLTSDDLAEAINTALAQAKASGEFDGADGEDGDDGTSVTVTNVTESTEDGGSNVVTFSDGKTLTVKNGKKGDTGALDEAQVKAITDRIAALETRAKALEDALNGFSFKSGTSAPTSAGEKVITFVDL